MVAARRLSDMDLSLFELRGKSALVTGASMGLGRACATALAMAGANVAVLDIEESSAVKTVEKLRSRGVDSFFVHCDVSNKAQVRAAVAAVVARFGRLDIAINNAGFGIPVGGSENLAQEEWNRVIGINLTGVFLCAQAEAEQMINQEPTQGKIINIASMYGSVAGGNCAYNAAKAGVIHLTKTLAAEWGRFNINVNCISPSWVMTRRMMHLSEEVRSRMRAVTPMGHIQRPEDMFGPVIFLASQASNFVTGHDLLVDGGHTVNTWLSPLERTLAPRVTPEEEIFDTAQDADDP
ncbi:3-oxoacyl-ACP reductase [Steroidobacter agaridevorans]|nr:3-oxoacyl-ACP reductase [Steroidobacter agaridevorans]